MNVIEEKKSLWTDLAFYSAIALLVTAVSCYILLAVKLGLQNQKVADVDKKIALYGTLEQKGYEQKVFDYKKRIDDFALLIENHRISSNVLNFIEQKTLPGAWFSNFDMSGSTDEMRLTGEAQTMEVLSQQIQLFEKSKDYIFGINVLNSEAVSSGKVSFVVSFSLDPKIFSYTAPIVTTAPNLVPTNGN